MSDVAPRGPSPSPTIGLALSGGAVRGAAHVGVLKVLEREGIVPSLVAGTSVGALVGAAWAAGLSAAEIATVFRELKWPDMARVKLLQRYGLLDTSRLGRIMTEQLGIDTIEELARPFAAVSCDLLTGDEVVFREGDLATALRASTAVPGVFPPLEREGRLLVDGCVVDNLPVRVARSMGADYVIAVDLIPKPRGGRKPRNYVEFIVTAGYLWSRANHPDPSTVECYITPDVAGFMGWDFQEVPELERRGREAALAVLPRLRRDLGLPGPASGDRS